MYVYIAAPCLISYVYAQSMWARLHLHFWREVQRQAGEMLLLAAYLAGRVLGAFRGSGHGGAERRQISDRLLGVWGWGVSFKGAAAVLRVRVCVRMKLDVRVTPEFSVAASERQSSGLSYFCA